jgi:hypothetical protein
LQILASRFSAALQVTRLALRVRRHEDVLIAGAWSAEPTTMDAGTTHPASGSVYEGTFDLPLRRDVPIRLGLHDLPSAMSDLFKGESVMSGIVVPVTSSRTYMTLRGILRE